MVFSERRHKTVKGHQPTSPCPNQTARPRRREFLPFLIFLPAMKQIALMGQPPETSPPAEKQWEVIDGRKEATRIPLDAAFSTLFLMLAQGRPGSDIRREGFLKESQIPAAGAEIVFASADRFFRKQQDLQKRMTALKNSAPRPWDEATRRKMDELMAEASAAAKEEMELLVETMRRTHYSLLLMYLNHRLMPSMQVGVEKKTGRP